MMVMAKYSERFGMTLSNLLSIIGLVIMLFGFFINFRLQMARIESRIIEVDLKYQLKTDDLTRQKDVNVYNIEQGRKENREEHQMILDAINNIAK